MPVLDGQPEVHYFDERFREEALAQQKAGASAVAAEVEPERVTPKKPRKSTKKA